MTQAAHDELYDRARQAIRDLKEKLAAAEARRCPEAVAVVGMGIRFPGAGTDLDRFWEMIRDGEDATTEIPADRWDRDAFYAPGEATPGKMNTRRAAFIEDVSHFDAAFFDITPHEAARMDPQQRIFLETAWHAVEDAGLTRQHLSGSDTGVFVGVHTHSADYQAMLFSGSSVPDAYAGSGTAHDMIGGRLAYWLDLHGPSITVNTACSSSLMAVHLACRSIRSGECTVAIVGGVNLLLKPVSTVAASQLQLLAPDGRCKTFDARADGMGRGEGCGVVVLKGLAAARQDGDRIFAVIRGSAVNQDGRTNGLTAPNGLAQQRLIRRALEDAGVSANEIGYVETHGTGTALGDPIEVEALAEVFGSRNGQAAACGLGAVKANIGHLEGAAGIAGVIKAVLVLRHRWIPPVASLKDLNAHLRPYASMLNFPKQGQPWEGPARRVAAVSSFGWSGTNVHVVLEEGLQAIAVQSSAVLPLLLSAASEGALDKLIVSYRAQLERIDAARVADLCYTSAVRRTHYRHRIAVCGGSREELASALQTRRDMGIPAGMASSELSRSMMLWGSGEEVDWQRFFPGQYSVLPGPVYPFEPVRHWIEVEVEQAPVAAPGDWMYEAAWVAVAHAEQVAGESVAERWLVIHDGEEGGMGLAEAATEAGHNIVEFRRGSEAAGLSSELQKLSTNLFQEQGGPRQVLYLVGAGDAMGEIAELLELARSLVRLDVSARLSIVSVKATGGEGAFAEAAARGFSRTFALEYPDHAGPFIQLESLSAENIASLFAELERQGSEARVRLSDGQRYVARLRRSLGLIGAPSIGLRAEKSYLITGAFGRIGLHVARWMVELGARHLVLVGRRDPSVSGRAGIEVLRGLGATVVISICDISAEIAVQRLFAEIAAAGPPLAGVVHAASENRFGAITEAFVEQVMANIEHVFSAKVEGGRILDRLTRSLPLDFFVLFSSAAATIGMRDAALYAAANSCLDAIVKGRRAAGLPALCVEWGFWDEQDGADDPQRQRQLLHESGFLPMRPEAALRVLGQLIASGSSSALVAAIDWTILAPLIEGRGGSALIEGIHAVKGDENPSRAAESLEALSTLENAERTAVLLELVGGEVRKIFGMAPDVSLDVDRGLFQLGMTSLMSVQLKRNLELRTGLRLPGSLTFTYPSIKALVRYLSERIVPAAARVPPVADDKEDVTAVLQMSEAETAVAIAAEVAAVNARVGRR